LIGRKEGQDGVKRRIGPGHDRPVRARKHLNAHTRRRKRKDMDFFAGATD